MLKGIIYALAACVIWGLIFVVPQFMPGFTPIEVAIGRYSIYALISLGILLKSRLQGAANFPLAIWVQGIYFSFASTFGYYIFLVLALRYASPQLAALIVGISPIAISFYGNWRQKECSFKSLILPSVLIFAGLMIINIPYFLESEVPTTYLLGILCSFVTLFMWSWYVVHNAAFLQENPKVDSSDWATIIGVATFFWIALFGAVSCLFFPEQFDLQKYSTLNPELINYIGASLVLGILCSWLANYLWNKASLYLPVTFTGQLSIFETIFGIIYAYSLSQSLPPLSESLGIFVFLTAIVYAIRTNLKTAQHQH